MTPLHLQTVAAIFVRHPVPGRVKTRLATDLGDEPACDLYRAMVADGLANVKACGLPLLLFHDGRDAAGLPPEWTGSADLIFGQEGESLGERMSAAFERSFAAGATGVILTGSDIPGIDTGLLSSAREALELYDIVISPAFDGGYCLVASTRGRYNSLIFQGIPWSTPYVLEMTVAACSDHGLSYRLLEPRQDIDTMDDLAAYCRRPSGSAHATNAWLIARGLMPVAR
ncbi:MAG: TIGR04282 family arsenosugar biosynthesis glycosyltransferase [Geobacteraceae bacterium]|nr:TIGR04282 family arsenosugar biosynthesis glycosyltransferase [Geobacteraceae bacterium]